MTAKHLTGSAFTEGHFSSSLDRRSSTSDGVPFRRRGRRSTAPHVENNNIFNNLGGTRWRTCLRRCATGRMAADSVCDGVPATFQLLNPSARTMAARPSQRLTKISTRDVSWVGGGRVSRRPVHKVDKTFMCRMSRNPGGLHPIELPRNYSDL